MGHFIAAFATARSDIPLPPEALLDHLRSFESATVVSHGKSYWCVGGAGCSLQLSTDADTRHVWAAGSATLHNRTEIDAELHKRSRRACETDLARIATGFELFGVQWFLRLRGPYAAVLRNPTGNIVVVRDQLGLCPLYYVAEPDALYVSTDLRALTELDCFDWNLDPLGLAHAVSGLWDDARLTAWSQIRRLPAGHVLVASGTKLEINDYWNPVARVTLQKGKCFNEYALETETLLAQAVQRCMGPGRTALELSGGFDSSTVAGFVARNKRPADDRPLALTFDLSHAGYTDKPFAEAVVKAYDLEWQLIPAQAGKQTSIDRAIRWRDLPGNYLWDEGEQAQRIARQSGAVRYLTGQLGDVVFVAENWAALMSYILMPNPLFVLKHSHWGRRLPANIRELIRRHPLYRRAADHFRPLTGCSFLESGLRDAAGFNKRALLPNPFDRDAALVSRATKLRTPQIQRVMELMHRMGVESGLAVGHPLADVDLVEFIVSVPPGYFIGEPNNRALHAAAAFGVLPPEVVSRTDKADFSGIALDTVRKYDPGDLIDHSVLAEHGWIDKDKARAVLQRVLESGALEKVHGQEIWEVIGLVETELFLHSVVSSVKLAH